MTTEGASAEGEGSLSWAGALVGGRYLVESTIGVGGMATVYLATDERMKRRVVLKVPHAHLLGDEAARKRFELEVRSLTALEHPQVVKAIDVGTHAGMPYVVLQYLAGGNLRDRLVGRPSGMPRAEILRWLPAVAEALGFIHERGMVHRDVKPENILFDEEGHAFLADFGIAKALASEVERITRTGQTPGSPEYMGPEALTSAPVGQAYDQYALAAIVYLASSGSLPVRGATPVEILIRKRTVDPEPLSAVAPSVPPVASAAVMRALARDPASRFPSCVAFARAFVESCLGAAAPGAAAAPAPAKASGIRGRRRLAAFVGGVAALAAAAAIISMRTSGRPDAAAGGQAWAVAAPAEGQWIAARTVHVSGRGRAEKGERLLVNGVPASLRDGGFEATLEAPQDGDLSIRLEREVAGRTTLVEARTVHIDATPPRVEIDEPAEPRAAYAGGSARVRGRAIDANLLEVRADGAAVPVHDGAFEVVVPLAEGQAAVLSIEATDRAGNRSDVARRTLERVSSAAAPLEQAMAAGRARDWAKAATALAKAKASGAPASEIPAWLTDGIAATAALDQAAARAKDHDWESAASLVSRARRLGSLDAEVPRELAAGLATYETLRAADMKAAEGDWQATEALVLRARGAGATDADFPASLADRLFAHARIVEARSKADAKDWDGARRLLAEARGRGATDADIPRSLREDVARGIAPASLAVLEPAEGVEVWAASVPVRGTFTAGLPTDRVLVNGVETAAKDGAFEATVALDAAEGPQVVVVRVEDRGVLRAEARRTVKHRVEPSIEFLKGWAEPLGTEIDAATHYPSRLKRTHDGAQMVFVPAGTFTMGATPDAPDTRTDSAPPHSVTLTRPYYFDVAQVTVTQFSKFVADTGYRTSLERVVLPRVKDKQGRWIEAKRKYWRDPRGFGGQSSMPGEAVGLLSYSDATAYAGWAGAQVPTEAQFERAVRYCRDAPSHPAGPSGLRGAGWTWCMDGYDASWYSKSPNVDPRAPVASGEERVVRAPETVAGRAHEGSPAENVGLRFSKTIP